jgi:hypothetical protein
MFNPQLGQALFEILPGSIPNAGCFWFLHTFGAESQSSALSAPKASTFRLGYSYTTRLTQFEQHQHFH